MTPTVATVATAVVAVFGCWYGVLVPGFAPPARWPRGCCFHCCACCWWCDSTREPPLETFEAGLALLFWPAVSPFCTCFALTAPAAAPPAAGTPELGPEAPEPRATADFTPPSPPPLATPRPAFPPLLPETAPGLASRPFGWDMGAFPVPLLPEPAVA